MKSARWVIKDRHVKIARRAAGIAARAGSAGSIVLAMASGSTTVTPAEIPVETVLFPEPFGPATNISVGTGLTERRQLSQYYDVRIPRTRLVETNLEAISSGALFDVPANCIPVHDGMTRAQRCGPSVRARVRNRGEEVIIENTERNHLLHHLVLPASHDG